PSVLSCCGQIRCALQSRTPKAISTSKETSSSRCGSQIRSRLYISASATVWRSCASWAKSRGRPLRMHDAIIVGGGPGGSTAAWRLAQSGVRVLVLDGARFPRVKLCAGWVTRRVWAELGLDPANYPLTVQPFARATLELDGAAWETAWDHIVSFGIVRREFDHFLLERARAAGAEVIDGARVLRLERRAGRFVVETPKDDFAAPLLIGAGGHHCPVARAFGEIPEREAVV